MCDVKGNRKSYSAGGGREIEIDRRRKRVKEGKRARGERRET
jgi:hypothetical protein